MAWVKLDDGFFNNQKIVSVSKDAKIIYLAALCHAGATLSDGFIPRNAVAILAAQCDVRSANKAIAELVEARLWKQVDGGFSIHDYLEHNTSSQEVDAKQEAARERMRRKRSQNVRANNERSSQEVRVPEDRRQKQKTENPSTGVLGDGASAPAKPPAKRASQIPETWMPSDGVREWAKSEGMTNADVDSQILRFVDHWRGEGKPRKDWDATFRNWMRNAREWGHLDPANAKQAKSGGGQFNPSDFIASIGDDDEHESNQEGISDIGSVVAEGHFGRSPDTSMGAGSTRPGLRSIAGGGG